MSRRLPTPEEPIATQEYSYTCLFEPEPEGGFTVTCPALPGLVTYGETIEEAREHATEAIELYLECLQEDGLPIPASEDHEPIRDRVTVKIQTV